jgi:hypothetical protein
VTIRPPEYKPPPRRAYTDIGWVCAALIGPAAFLALWIYCTVTYGVLIGFFLGWIPAFILALVVAVAMIYLWPVTAAAIVYLVYRGVGNYPELLAYVAALIAILAIAFVWW